MRNFILIRLGLIALAAVIGITGGMIFRAEYRNFSITRLTPILAMDTLAENDEPIPDGWSIRAQTRSLETCNEALILPIARVGHGAMTLYARKCLTFADRVVARSPTWGLAHFSQARARYGLGDNEGAVMALDAALSHAPNEGWIAQKRVLLALELLPNAAANAIFERDILFLMADPILSDWLARLYVALPAQRGRIVDIADLATAEQKRIFLSRTKHHLEAGS